MPHHEYVEDVLQEIEVPDKIEKKQRKSYFVCAPYSYIHAKDRVYLSPNTITAIYADSIFTSVYRSIITQPGYQYRLIVQDSLEDLLS